MQYSAPETIESALKLLESDDDARVMAGGTDLIVQMTSGMRSPSHVVDIKRIPELCGVVQTADGGWKIGAAVPGAELNEHVELKRDWPGFVEATDLIGSMQVQGRATPVGNLCNASPAGDAVPGMVAAGATVTVAGSNGFRDVAAHDVPAAPGRTNLEKNEFVIAVNLPPKPPNSGDAYLRFIPRTEMDIAVVGTGVFLAFGESGHVREARIALGAIAPTVVFCTEAADALIGSRLEEEAIEAAVLAARNACNPIDDKRGTAEFRVHTVGVLIKRSIAIATQRAKRQVGMD
ncbi:FAD binding domain-containing protein [Hoeflea poritis]|uniref:Xanthine dehydrogenase family protein subunit M n=1 Tax=Hoeflea poritis TaxID=2993659 RepID=A0ABT4VWX2_9HYPH|nr:xanthine dehydrogenase family protein subunit M [Hoeflea poritis]MDA4848542.1 xanthine dehydrogenase family protein subunit M [Hoeflea poritis]